MSSLQCAATLLVARHGDATYAHPGVLSNDGGCLTEKGRTQATALAESVRSRRIAAVYSSSMHRAVQTAEIVAAALGVRARVVQGLQEFAVGGLAGLSFHDPRVQHVFEAWAVGDLDAGCPGAETGLDVLARYRSALEEIADLHRGETVVVISHGQAMSLAIPRIADNVPDAVSSQRFLPNCAAAEVRRDDDGWALLSWPGSIDRSVI